MSWSSQKRKEGIFLTIYFARRKFFSVLSQCKFCWILFQNIHTFTYKKHYFNTFLYLQYVSLSTLIRVTPFKTRMFWMFRTRAVNHKHKIRPLHETGLTLAKPWLLRTCHQKVTILLFMRKIFKNWWLNSANIAMVFWFP